MGMVVQHNVSAMNANRNLGVTSAAQAKSTEKLSTGLKINRAADDASGLAISEKMRRQIRGLSQASSNAQDGISAAQTAEGALTEVHDMLQRMNELANKAANGTNSKSDRQSIQDEIDQLSTEIDRVAETTKFNELYLMKGSSGTKTLVASSKDAGLEGILADQGNTATFTTELVEDSDISISGKTYHIYNEETDQLKTLQDQVEGADTVTINGTTYTKVKDADAVSVSQTSALALTACVEKKGASAAKYSACATKYSACATKFEASGAKKIASAALRTSNQKTREACAETLLACANRLQAAGNIASAAAVTSKAAVKKSSAAIWQVSAATLKASAAAIQAKGASIKGGRVQSLTDTAASIQACADAIKSKYGLESGATTVKFKSNGQEYTADQLKELITDGAKVAIGDVKATTAVDIENNKNNKTLNEVKDLIKEALLQANKIGVDDTTDVSVDETSNVGNSYTYTITKGSMEVAQAMEFNLHVGADADLTNKINVSIETMNSKYLGVQGLQVADDTGNLATYAIDAIEKAITKVSEQRSALGAVQNRLEHTIKNLDNIVENTTSAESEIRDTDMATEMVNYSKNNILAQAGQSMLAQANQSNQGVLSLLG